MRDAIDDLAGASGALDEIDGVDRRSRSGWVVLEKSLLEGARSCVLRSMAVLEAAAMVTAESTML